MRGSRSKFWSYSFASLLTCAAPPLHAEESDAFARVIASETELRAGPGVSHRVIYRAARGETFLLETRETAGFWFLIVLPDGRSAYVLGDAVERFSVDSDAPDVPSKPGLFAPPALEEARGGLALMAGLYDRDGYVELKPALVIAPAIAFEPYIGLALQSDSRRFIYGGGATLNLAPDWAIAPFVHIGTGGMHEEPKDEFVQRSRDWFHARAAGGLLVSLRFRLLFRLEASNMVLFAEDDYQNVQSYLGGLGSYF